MHKLEHACLLDWPAIAKADSPFKGVWRPTRQCNLHGAHLLEVANKRALRSNDEKHPNVPVPGSFTP